MREIYYSSHIDGFIYQRYSRLINKAYNKYVFSKGLNNVATAYRDVFKGKCNIHFAKEVFEFIIKKKKVYIFVGDFSSFFDTLDHKYLKEKIELVLNNPNKIDCRLPDDYYAVYKSITKFCYLELEVIEKELEKNISKYFDGFNMAGHLDAIKKEYELEDYDSNRVKVLLNDLNGYFNSKEFAKKRDKVREKRFLNRVKRELINYILIDFKSYFKTTKEFREFKKKNIHVNNENYGIPQGSPISAVLSNVYLIDFDKQMNDYVNSKEGLYRRYCDDFVVIIPVSEYVVSEFAKFENKILEIAKNIKNLKLQKEKVSQYYYEEASLNLNSNAYYLKNLDGDKKVINYLGFSFDGKNIKIRDKSLFRYYSRLYKKIKRYGKAEKKKKNAVKKSIYRVYTHLGEKNCGKYGNFITYARKSQKILSESIYLKGRVKIWDQVKHHWKKVNKRIKKYKS